MKLTIKTIEAKINFWQNVKSAWEATADPNDDFNKYVYVTYLHTCSVAETANMVNELGFRKKGYKDRDIKFISNDISELISSVDIADQNLQNICRHVLNDNRMLSGKTWG